MSDRFASALRLPCGGALLLVLLLVLPVSGPAGPAFSEGTFAFVGVGLLPMDGGAAVLENQTVVVSDGTVTRVGPADEVSIPSGAEVIRGTGLWLLPGLAEMHAHLPGPQLPEAEMDDLLFLYLANGVTTIRTMLGAPNHLELRRQVASGERLGPTVFAAAPSLSGQSAPTPDAAEAPVRQHAAAGYDLLKLHPQLSRETYDRIVEVARDEGLTWAGHVSVDVGLDHSLATGKSTVDHLDGYLEAAASPEIRRRIDAGEAVPLAGLLESITPERMDEVARATAEAGTWNAPTMYLWENFYNDAPADELAALPEMRYASGPLLQQWRMQKEARAFVELLESWRTDGVLGRDDVSAETGRALIRFRRDMLAALHAAGAPILLGTDSPQMFMVPGFSLHRELAVMVESGIPPLAILESGSRNVSRYAAEELGYEGVFGSVVPGARADLVLVEGNPLEDLGRLRDPAGVMVRGRWLPRELIRSRLDEIAERTQG
jgi:imidazolonepropionase-like amidohydrolase